MPTLGRDLRPRIGQGHACSIRRTKRCLRRRKLRQKRELRERREHWCDLRPSIPLDFSQSLGLALSPLKSMASSTVNAKPEQRYRYSYTPSRLRGVLRAWARVYAKRIAPSEIRRSRSVPKSSFAAVAPG